MVEVHRGVPNLIHAYIGSGVVPGTSRRSFSKKILAFAAPSAMVFASRRAPVPTRRWECNLQLLRRSFAKNPEAAAITLEELHAALMKREADADLRPEFAPLLVHVLKFFDQTVRSNDLLEAKEGLVLPTELVYYSANRWHEPPKEPPLMEDSVEKLTPIAKACKLDKEQRPRDSRDPRRSNRVLHLCQSCYSYKLPCEYYLCCLHDSLRCCRECMLSRPSEPFGEHALEESRTRQNLQLVDLALDFLSTRVIDLARNKGGGSSAATESLPPSPLAPPAEESKGSPPPRPQPPQTTDESYYMLTRMLQFLRFVVKVLQAICLIAFSGLWTGLRSIGATAAQLLTPKPPQPPPPPQPHEEAYARRIAKKAHRRSPSDPPLDKMVRPTPPTSNAVSSTDDSELSDCAVSETCEQCSLESVEPQQDDASSASSSLEDHARIILGVTMLVILAAYATLDRNPSLVLSVWALPAVIIPFVAIAWVHTKFPSLAEHFSGDLEFWTIQLPEVPKISLPAIPPSVGDTMRNVHEAVSSTCGAVSSTIPIPSMPSMPSIEEVDATVEGWKQSAHETTSLLKQHAEETRQALGRRAKKAKQKASATASAALQALEQASSIAEEPTVTLPPPFEQHGGSSSSSAPAAAGRPPSPPQQHEAGGKSLSEVTEQLDRIEAAVLSLADAFGGLQRQVDALKQQQQPIAAAPVVAEEKGGAVWADEQCDEPSSEA